MTSRFAIPKVRLFALVAVSIFALEWAITDRSFQTAVGELEPIYGNSIPSLMDMADISNELVTMRHDMRRLFAEPPTEATRMDVESHVRSVLATLRVRVRSYEKLPAWPGEPELQSQLDRSLDALEAAVEQVFRASSYEELHKAGYQRFLPVTDSVHEVILELVRLDARSAAESARQVQRAHDAAGQWSLLTAITGGLLLVIAGGVVSSYLGRESRETAERMAELDAFAARVAHDLKAPLSVVPLGVGLLRREAGDALNEAAQASLRRIDSATFRMSALIDGLLAFARAGAKPEPGATASVDEVAKSIRSTIKPALETERAELVVEAESGLRVRAADFVLGSIVQNLVRNAVAYLGDSEKRVVTLRARREGAAVLIAVEDTGPGIPEDVRRRLFRPFERGSTTVPGHGLGLATVKRLADSHGGSVEVDSVVGRGSIFRVRLPAA